VPDLGWDLGVGSLETLLVEAGRAKGSSLWAEARARLFANRVARWSLCFLVGFCLLSFLAPVLPLPSPVEMNLQLEPQPPIWPWESFVNPDFEPEYWPLNGLDRRLLAVRKSTFGKWQTGQWLGTDSKGRDILSRILWGSRTSILVALAAAACSLTIGVLYGSIAGLSGGWIDRLMMRTVDVLYSLPFIFVVIFVLSLLDAPDSSGEGHLVDREKVFYLVIGAIYWLTMARVVRGQVLTLKHAGFIATARAMGAGPLRILCGHVLPNILSIVVVYLTLTIPAVMLFEAFLSFLGLGIEPPRVSWGLLAVDGIEAINPIRMFWWLAIFPAAAMAMTLLALNLLGDGIRDALDPRSRGSTELTP
jgi:oligopeptide transport system permease protein